MFGRRPAPQVQADIPCASTVRAQHEQAVQQQRDRNQRDFNRWVDRKLVPAINRFLSAAVAGQTPWQWQNRQYDSTFVATNHLEPGVRVTTFVDYIFPVIQDKYRAAGYRVETETVTELPDHDFRTGRGRGMRQLSRPMYITTIFIQ